MDSDRNFRQMTDEEWMTMENIMQPGKEEEFTLEHFLKKQEKYERIKANKKL